MKTKNKYPRGGAALQIWQREQWVKGQRTCDWCEGTGKMKHFGVTCLKCHGTGKV